jgi:hypothetical protein
MGGIYAQAKRNKSLRDSGLFEEHPYLEDAILVAVIHHIYVVFKRDIASYFFIDKNYNAKVMKVISDTDKLTIDSLVAIVESLLQEKEPLMAVKKVAKPNLIKAKTKASIVKKPVSKAKTKEEAISAEPKPVKVRKTRKSKDSLSSYANLLKKQKELVEAKKLAQTELRQKFDEYMKESDKVKEQYKKLFGETIESAPKGRKVAAKKATGRARGFSLDQIESFLNQVDNGGKIKIEGKNATGIARIKAAYEKSPDKGAESILAFLNK